MSKTKEINEEFTMDMEAIQERTELPKQAVVYEEEQPKVKQKTKSANTDELINCLSNKIITVKYIPQAGTVSDPKHVLYGGLAETSTITFTVPRLRSGVFKDVLTKAEKAYLEMCMGLEDGALNVYNKHNNFWDNSTEGGISKVRLTKQETHLHLNDPVEYIYYKILLANKEFICPDLQTLADKPKATYKYVLISNEDVSQVAKTKMDIKKQCWIEFGKVETNEDVLRTIIEIMTGKPLSKNTKIEFLQTKIGELIDSESKLFLNIVKDPLLSMRILIKKGVEQGFISKRGDWYYLRSDGTPLCEGGEEPTLSMAAKYLSNPKRQDMKFALEAKIK